MHVGSPGIATKVYPYPGYCATVLQKSQKFRVLWHRRTGTYIHYINNIPVPRVFKALAFRTPRSLECGYECRTELPEVPGTGMHVVQNFQKFQVRV